MFATSGFSQGRGAARIVWSWTAGTAYDNRDHLRDLNSIASTFQLIKDVFDMMATDTAKAWQNIVTRLETIGTPVEHYRNTLAAGADADMSVSRRQVLAAIEEGRIAEGPNSPFSELLTVQSDLAVLVMLRVRSGSPAKSPLIRMS